MGVFRFAPVLFLSVLLSFGGVLQVEETLSVVEYLEPSTFEVSLSVKVRGKDEFEAVRVLGEVDEAIRNANFTGFKSLFRVYPVREREGDRLVVKGFEGVIDYLFRFGKPEDLQRLLDLLKVLKEKNEGLTVKVNYERWTVPEEEVRRTIVRLKERLIEKVKTAEGEYSKTFNASCRAAKVQIYKERPRFLLPQPLTAAKVPRPPKEEWKVELRARVTFECYR
ncbi:MAG: hypothetical protein GXO08_04550 [Aquificae bacterium]|nr:hypothetical protein [Aquificota bacterium]